MSSELTKEQQKELQKLVNELNDIAGDAFNDYTNNPSEMSLLAFNLMYAIVFYELQHLKYNFYRF